MRYDTIKAKKAPGWHSIHGDGEILKLFVPIFSMTVSSWGISLRHGSDPQTRTELMQSL